jgi:hypothetical protein
MSSAGAIKGIFGAIALLWGAALAGQAAAQCGTPACPPPAPPCNTCQPPTPPPCCGGGHDVRVPGVRINVMPSIIVNQNVDASVRVNSSAASAASAYGSATASASGSAFNGLLNSGAVYGGGGQSFYTAPGMNGYIQGLMVEQPALRRRVAFEATRKTVRRVVIQAFCLDDREVPHPASQVTPDREIGDYDGEIYRCIAGTRLQYVVAEYAGKVAFDGGQTQVCAKNSSLYYSSGENGGTVSCRPQKAARDCNERSLLRRFGAGVKILTMVSLERYTDYREEVIREGATYATSLTLDGGVGGVAF